MKVPEAIREKRRKQTNEFFTPLDLAIKMIKKFPPEFWGEDKTFLDPNAGNGNLLVLIYRYKVEKYNHDPTTALSTIYGVELQSDNVAECKLRLYAMAKTYGVDPSKAQSILSKNIVCADALTFDYEFQ